MIQLAKSKGIPVAVSSSDSTDQYKLYLDAGADYILLGEAEETLKELVEALKNEQDVGSVKGLVYRKNGESVNTGRRPVLRDLDQLPMPVWDLIDIESYRQIWQSGNGYFSLNLATTRGCPFKCNWCAKPIYGQKYNSRSPKHVVEEVAYLMQHFQPDHFWMCDDIFGLKPNWVQEFDRLLKEKNLKIKYTIQSRVDLMLEGNQIDALASSGLHEVWVGAESGSQKILDAMDKGTKLAQIEEATKLLQQKGIKVAFFLQFGYPGETRADIQKTIDMVLRLMPDNIGVSVSYPLPGTPFYDTVKSQLGNKANWEDSDDLDLMFSNTYPKDYYRKLQRYIHRLLRLKQGAQAKSFRAMALYPYYKITTKLDKARLTKIEQQYG
jgi:anaerobic magnesium-protoporphyrin IX monomethyl ester cyclase